MKGFQRFLVDLVAMDFSAISPAAPFLASGTFL